jgi:ATP-dependent helicase/nuclease subunit A
MDDATRNQIEAADPACSTWLTANAGSGKTRVLTDRVARLLLGGTRPERILCLTYTKAAATEMQNRLLARLGRWAMLPETDLRRELADLGLTRGSIHATAHRAVYGN